jgi:hypothetical protein
LNIGDLVNLYHPTLGIKIQTKITQIEYDFENQDITLGISNSTRILSDMEKFIMNSYQNNKISNDYSNRKIDWQKTSYNFNARNDRISDIPADPSFGNNVSDITHVKNDDGSVSLTVNWVYPTDTTKNIYNIDGFNIYLYASKTKETVVLGSLGSNESILNVSSDVRKCTIPSVPANQFYYVGIQAYRDVDNDISTNGILLSNIITSAREGYYPYQPEQTVDIQGRLNGIDHSVGDKAPDNPQINDTWLDTSTNTQKIYTSSGWEAASAGAATSVNGYVPDTSITPSTIVVRNNTGTIPGNITGSASQLNGKPDTAFAQLDSNGKVNTSVLPTVIAVGSYTGDGTSLRTITLPFNPKIVKVYSTNTSDISLFINSTNGGYKLNTSTSSLVLVGMADGTPYSQFGKLSSNSFIVGQDSNLYGNKSNILYYYEAF